MITCGLLSLVLRHVIIKSSLQAEEVDIFSHDTKEMSSQRSLRKFPKITQILSSSRDLNLSLTIKLYTLQSCHCERQV